MTRFLTGVLVITLMLVLVGCGQKGDLYLPTQQLNQQMGL